MAKFFVGQMVRIVYLGTSKRLIGREARITKWRDDGHNRYGDYCGWQLDVKNDFGRWVVAMEDWIEPILDRHEPCESEFKQSLDKLLSEVRHEAVE